MDEKKREELLDHAWKYFSLHAEQRLKTFNFYLIICTVVAGGVLALIKDAKEPRIAIPLSLLLPFFSVVFWKLDTRNRQLIDHGQDALKFFENDLALASQEREPQVIQILLREKNITDRDRPWTYRRCFNAVFWMFGVSGVVAAIYLSLGVLSSQP